MKNVTNLETSCKSEERATAAEFYIKVIKYKWSTGFLETLTDIFEQPLKMTVNFKYLMFSVKKWRKTLDLNLPVSWRI